MRLERFERYRAMLDIYSGNLTSADKWATQLQLSLDTPVNFQTRPKFWVIARLRLAQARYAEAAELLNHIEASLPTRYRVVTHWTCRLLRTLLYAATGRLDSALPLLKTVVDEPYPSATSASSSKKENRSPISYANSPLPLTPKPSSPPSLLPPSQPPPSPTANSKFYASSKQTSPLQKSPTNSSSPPAPYAPMSKTSTKN